MDYSSLAEGQNTCLKHSLSNYYDWIFIIQIINFVKKYDSLLKKSSYHASKIQLKVLFGRDW